MIINSEMLVDKPLVSVVIPSYNRKDLINRTIDSILNQQCNFEFEIVISDDCSIDGVRDLLLKYQQKYPEVITLIFHESNIGLGANWAYAIKHCRGTYVANCDNDDYWHNPEKLQLQVDYMVGNPDCGVCHTYRRNYFNSSDKFVEINYNYNDKIDKPLYLAIFHLEDFDCCNSSILYRKEVLDKYINTEEYIEHRFTLQDWNTWVILAFYTRFYCLPVSTTTVLIDNNSITRNTDYDSLLKRMIREEDTYKYVCSKFPETLHYDPNEYKTYTYTILLNAAFKRADYRKAEEFSRELNKLGFSSHKTKIAQTFIGFHLSLLAKKLKVLIRL